MQNQILPILEMSEMKPKHIFYQNDIILVKIGDKKLFLYYL